MKYFDTHCHLNGDFYTTNIDTDIRKALESKVHKILIPGTNERDSLLAIEMSKQMPDILYAAVGIHPSEAAKESTKYLKNIDPSSIIAVGEVGIDLYHKENPPLKIQEEVFREHLEWAKKYNKPVLIHMRDAEEEVLRILKDYPKLKFVLHSFTGDSKSAQKFLKLGGYISFSGIVTFKNAANVQNAARNVPLDRILIETDAPYLTPAPHRGGKNRPEYVRFVATFLAKLRYEDETYFSNSVWANSLKFFGVEE